MTIAFYDKHGQDFANRTQYLDLTSSYQRFLVLVPENGHVLDAGCGSGRDTKAFLERGYKVTALDASETMVTLATQLTDQQVLKMRFQELAFSEVFDGIWACASLLHVPRHELDAVFERFVCALKPGGVWYLSFKHGQSEALAEDGRWFNNLDREQLMTYVQRQPTLTVEQYWENADTRLGVNVTWVNAILRKGAS